MKKFRSLLLTLVSLSLISCNKDQKACLNHIDSNHDGKCDVCSQVVSFEHIDSNDDNICDVCGASLSKDITKKTVLETNSWNQDLRDMIGFVIGDEYSSMVASMPNSTNFKCYFEDVSYEDGSGSQLTCIINCYGVNPENAMDEYDASLISAGFYLGYSTDYGYKLLSATKDLIIQYGVFSDSKGAFLELLIYVAETRMSEWPSEDAAFLIGADIPVYECESYELYYDLSDDYSPFVVGYFHNTGVDGLVNYHNQIMATNEYTLVSNTADGYTYLSKDGKISLGIYPVADEYNRDSIYITVSNNWPFFYTTMMLGEDIPCYNMAIMEWMFQDIDGDGSAEYLTIFFDNVTQTNYDSYVQMFISCGWQIDTAKSSTTYKVIYKRINGTREEIEVIYDASRQSICVAFTD